MLISLICSGCKKLFGVDDDHVGMTKKYAAIARVFEAFHCPYCNNPYEIGDAVQIAGVSGGVNISGAGQVHIGGDVVGGDLNK